MSPPFIGPVITVRIPPELLARLDADARRRGVSRAERLRAIVEEALK